MSDSMRKIVRSCFPKASRVIDRFHVQNLAYDAIQEMRIAHRWDAINEETDALEEAKLSGNKYIPEILENGDSNLYRVKTTIGKKSLSIVQICRKMDRFIQSKDKNKEPKYFSNFIQTSKKHTV